MKKGSLTFVICIVIILLGLVIAATWYPNRNIGEVRNIIEYTELTVLAPSTLPTLPPSYMIESSPVFPGEVVEESCVNWYSDYRVYPIGKVTTTAGGEEFDIDFLAKLLYCEAGGKRL